MRYYLSSTENPSLLGLYLRGTVTLKCLNTRSSSWIQSLLYQLDYEHSGLNLDQALMHILALGFNTQLPLWVQIWKTEKSETCLHIVHNTSYCKFVMELRWCTNIYQLQKVLTLHHDLYWHWIHVQNIPQYLVDNAAVSATVDGASHRK